MPLLKKTMQYQLPVASLFAFSLIGWAINVGSRLKTVLLKNIINKIWQVGMVLINVSHYLYMCCLFYNVKHNGLVMISSVACKKQAHARVLHLFVVRIYNTNPQTSAVFE